MNTAAKGFKSGMKVARESIAGFTSSDSLHKRISNDAFRLPGDIGELLGDLERYQLAITIEGDQGSGKTRFVYQLADAFIDAGFTVGNFSLEIGDTSHVVKNMVNQYLKDKNKPDYHITGQAEKGIDTIRKYAKDFDVIIIDSWNKLDVDSSEFDSLRKAFPDTIWVVIFQRTSQGTIRGGTRPLYDAGINLEAVKSDKGFDQNYVQATKNRYGDTYQKYFVKSKSFDEPTQ